MGFEDKVDLDDVVLVDACSECSVDAIDDAFNDRVRDGSSSLRVRSIAGHGRKAGAATVATAPAPNNQKSEPVI
jgi:hypothetical protein